MPFTSLTSCSCETGRVSGCSKIADSLPLDIDADEASGKAGATFPGSTHFLRKFRVFRKAPLKTYSKAESVKGPMSLVLIP
jgi:hypothetical protein